MEEKEIYISIEGLQKLKGELSLIEDIKLREIASRIAEAKDLGDLTENSEYHEAKQEQSFLMGKAQELKYKIRHAKIIQGNNHSGTVAVGSKVSVKVNGDRMELMLVGSDEADPAIGKISVDSPIGKALVGHKVGDSVSVKTPAGEMNYQIIKVK